MKKQLPGWAVLLIITLVAGLALGGTYALTKDPIAQQALLQAENARRSALPQADSFQELALTEDAPVDWANAGLKTVKGKAVPLTIADIDAISGATYTSTAVVDAINAAYQQYQAAPSDAVFTGEAQGFIGPVAVEATFDGDTISTLKIGDDRFQETEGLGAKALEDSFQSQFVGGEKVVGYVSQITVKGYKGPVEVTVGLDSDLTLTGISVGGSDFAETAGLGAKAKEPAFQEQFAGKKTPVTLIKQGGTPGDDTVDAITAATITSTAVVNGVNSVVKYVKSDILGIVGIEMPARPGDDQVFSASAQGFRGPVYVEAAFDGEGQVSYISVGDEKFAEDIGAGVKEPEFMYQFIGKAVPASVGDIDTISGATISSTAVVTALNEAYAASQGAIAEKPAEEPPAVEPTEAPAVEAPAVEAPAALPEKPAEGVFGAVGQGFRGPVYVEAAFDAEEKVSYISVGDDQFAEDLGVGVKEPAFLSQFIGKAVPASVGDIDAIAGATVSSTAVVAALNEAHAQAFPAPEKTEEPAPEITEVPAPEATEEPAPETTEAPVPEATEAPAARALPEGDLSYSGDAVTFFTAVKADVSFEDGVISELILSEKAVGSDEYRPMDQAAALTEQLIGQKAPVDAKALSGVPEYTASAVALAVNDAYAQYAAAKDEETAAVENEPVKYVGRCVMFFDRYTVSAAFEGDTLIDFEITQTPVGDDELILWEASPLYASLPGRRMPLDAKEFQSSYVDQAIVIALNEAYAQSLAGQQ